MRGSRVTTQGSVMNGPPSWGQVVRTGSLLQVESLASVFDRAVDDLLAGGVLGGDDLGEEVADLGEFGQQLELVEQAGGGFGLDQGADAVGDGVERVGFEGQLHAALGAELVHQDFGAGVAGDVLKEQGRAAGFGCAFVELGGAVGDLGHFQMWADGFADAAEFAGFVELGDPIAKVGIRHGSSSRGGVPPSPLLIILKYPIETTYDSNQDTLEIRIDPYSSPNCLRPARSFRIG